MKESVLSRKERIMKEALLLFSDQGYTNTSTKTIAQNAGVSEALIFKHFGNKDALLVYLIKSGYRKVLTHHRGMMTYREPKEFLRTMINLPGRLVSAEPIFWRLQERLSHHPFSKQQHEQFMKPVQPIIHRAFKELGYESPEFETEFLLLIIDTLWKKEAIGELENTIELTLFLEKKYNLI